MAFFFAPRLSESRDGRVFVENPGGKVLIWGSAVGGTVPILPRDVIAEFPLAQRADPRALWHIVAKSGETWETPSCFPFWVTSGRTHIRIDEVGILPGGPVPPPRFRLHLPDMVWTEPEIRWTKPPPNGDDWFVTWITSVQPR